MSVAFARSVALRAIRTYKTVVSPYLPVACRFSPTCSEYAFEAVEQYGLLRGVLRALSRLLRCHPLHRGGFDPLT
jgi:putative membrane protein insertion efficiency factor